MLCWMESYKIPYFSPTELTFNHSSRSIPIPCFDHENDGVIAVTYTQNSLPG